MATNNNYEGRLTEIISQEIVDNVGIQTAPLKNIVKDFTPEAGAPNAPVITSVQLGNQPGRLSHTLVDADDSVYESGPSGNDYESPDTDGGVVRRPGLPRNVSANLIPNYGRANWSKFRIFPQYIAEAAQSFSEPETENLNDPNFIRDKLAKPLKESVVRQVIGQYWNQLDPYFYADYTKSTVTNPGANQGVSYSPLGIMTDYDEFGVNEVSTLHTLLRKQLLEPQYDALLTPDLYDGLAKTTEGNGSLNWVIYTGSTAALQERMYLRLKGVNIHEVDPVDRIGDVQHGGIPWSQFSARASVPHRPGEPDKATAGTGTLSLGDIYDATDGNDKTVTTSMNVIGAVVHPRHMAFASWPQFSETQFAGGGLGFITRFFSDPLTGMNFRLRTYFLPQKLEYWFTLTVKFGFTKIDPQAAALIFHDAA